MTDELPPDQFEHALSQDAGSHVPSEAAFPTAVVFDDSRGRRLGTFFWLSVGWMGIVVLAAIAAPWLPLADPNQTGFGGRLDPPGGDAWFGTDGNGRDVFSRTLWGARISLVVGFVAIVMGIVFGGTLGILAGYYRGIADRIASFLMFAMLAFPGLVLALLLIAALGSSLTVVSVTLGVLAIAPVGRLARASTLLYAEREFVQAARLLGAGHGRIILRDLLPNVFVPLSGLALLGMAITVVAEGGLAFLGLSVADGFSWGKLIVMGSAPRTLREGPWVAMFPIGAMFLTVLALNYAGDRLRWYMDVRDLAFER
ncbi:MAG: ABC transporter permease [Acidimicrobiaceae bacterium]|nr:ABC transporter permease [Acidimicrobiaceae bacterium]|tara:strand:- start:1768 stop:2706 length:939 start_codon:yes stop_codon:yes gene_type:complete